MSLLHRGNETVSVFPETVVTDEDGNAKTRPSSVGLVARAVVQPINSSENADGGYNTSTRYRLRLVGWNGGTLGAQSQVEWNGKRYSIEGDALIYAGSPRTARAEYTMVRA